jgi:hypothetical protein
MAEDKAATQNTKPDPSPSEEKRPEIPSGKVLSGADDLFDGVTHVGVAIEVAASGKVSYVMIPDATKISSGKPIYITAPVELRGENLAVYLNKKGVNLDNALGKLLKQARVGCEAFYFSTDKETLDTQEKVDRYNTDNALTTDAQKKKLNEQIERGPLLMMFEVAVDGGLIGTLADDEDLGKLFDVNSVMLRVLRCPAGKRSVLEKYVQALPQE